MPVPGSPRPKALYVAGCTLQKRRGLNYPFRMAARKAAGCGHGYRAVPAGTCPRLLGGRCSSNERQLRFRCWFSSPLSDLLRGLSSSQPNWSQRNGPSRRLRMFRSANFWPSYGYPCARLAISDPHRHTQRRHHRPEAQPSVAAAGRAHRPCRSLVDDPRDQKRQRTYRPAE
jgi:hypothetical protein